ncbi:MAG TPA: type II toxin-antitoxin system RelE/ParE family toxin [Candidatus Sulfomarinibacteraceae bacterium]|nr:type II toxin-antitoxin system RelE/ParE family toxin [Candidatus Sulfomarinibacteraceae bacterium]
MTRVQIEWTRRACRDVLEIGDFIARDKPMAAAAWVRRLIDTVERVATFPRSGRVVPEIDRRDIREVVFENYRIVYLVGATRIAILTVFESHRLLSGEDLDPTVSR